MRLIAGLTLKKFYNGTRLLAANLTRFGIDAGSTDEWRSVGFYPVLNEREQSPQANTRGGLMSRMLSLKQSHPLPSGDRLPDSFDFSLNRKQQCAKIETFDSFEAKYPLWGMPFGLPALNQEEQSQLSQWLKEGGKVKSVQDKPSVNKDDIDRWELFFNGSSKKERLTSRYIYEHLFLASIYFDNDHFSIDDFTGENRTFYKLVRSKTPPGEAIKIIATRRPFDNPGGDFYYRLQRVNSTILDKQNMPYKFNQWRLDRWTKLFLDAEYEVKSLPSYDPAVASNPFLTFQDLPVKSRYEFMLDEAQFTIMGFIKGPVCRGQVALNVINDHFWVLFVDPDFEASIGGSGFLKDVASKLRLPAEKDSTLLTPISTWLQYSKLEEEYLQYKEEELLRIFPEERMLNLDLLWNGNGHNKNAALTIFRHFDSSSVIKGLHGDTPKTAWVISYPLLERIHYLLVAGFDVYGNVGHQLITRLYMDFLRIEGEHNFLQFLPNKTAKQEIDFWYRGQDNLVTDYVDKVHITNIENSGIDYVSDNPKKEFFELIRSKYGGAGATC